MTQIIVDRRYHNRLPRNGILPNLSHPQCDGLVHWFPMINEKWTMQDVMRGPNSFAQADPGWIPSQDGWNINSVTGVAATFCDARLAGSSIFSVSLWAKASSTENARGGMALRFGTSTSDLFLIYPMDNNGGDGFRTFPGVFNNNTSRPPADNRWHHCCYVQTAVNSRTVYVDGLPAAGANSNSLTLSSNLETINIGSWHGTTQIFHGSLRDIRVYDRPISPALTWQLYQDPWAPFERRAWIPQIVAGPPAGRIMSSMADAGGCAGAGGIAGIGGGLAG